MSSFKRLFNKNSPFHTNKEFDRSNSTNTLKKKTNLDSRRFSDCLNGSIRKNSFFSKFSEEYGFSPISSPANFPKNN